jgi:xylobiose transport system permease protein
VTVATTTTTGATGSASADPVAPGHGRGRPVGGTGRPTPVWALPGVVFFLAFAVVPMVLVAYLSFTQWDGLSSPQWIGTGNWTRLLHDPAIGQAVRLSLTLTALTWIVQTPISLLLGVWAAGRQKSRAVLSAIFFLPLLLSSAAIALLWKALLDPNFGLAAQVANWLHLSDANLLGSSKGALIAVAMVASWQFIPFHTLIYQGGSRQIPRTLYDAAAIDGAGMLRQFWSITLPQLRNTVITSSVLMVVGALTFFDTVLILTQGGPGTDTSIVPYTMYRTGFVGFEMGYASAIAFALVVVATAVSLLMVALSGFSSMRSSREGM